MCLFTLKLNKGNQVYLLFHLAVPLRDGRRILLKPLLNGGCRTEVPLSFAPFVWRNEGLVWFVSRHSTRRTLFLPLSKRAPLSKPTRECGVRTVLPRSAVPLRIWTLPMRRTVQMCVAALPMSSRYPPSISAQSGIRADRTSDTREGDRQFAVFADSCQIFCDVLSGWMPK